MKKVLVTGGVGFIGEYVCECLVNWGYTPLVFDHHGRGMPKFEVFLGDVRSETDVNEAMAHVDGWIHLAAVLGTQETMDNPRPAVFSNIEGGLNVLEAASEYGLPGAYIGVGNHWMNNPYSISKTTVERFVDMFNKYRQTRVNVVRAMNAYGPRQAVATPYGSARVRKITPSFIARAIHGDPLQVYGDGLQVSDMVYVKDVAEALVRALQAADGDVVLENAVEVGPSNHNTVLDVAKLVIELTASASDIEFLPMRPGELPDAVVSADNRTLERIGIHPDNLTSLREGMEKTVAYYQQHFVKRKH